MGNEDLIGARYFEGAASGSMMIGGSPKNEEFEKLFYWSNAVIQSPSASDNIDKVMKYMDMKPYRQELVWKKILWNPY